MRRLRPALLAALAAALPPAAGAQDTLSVAQVTHSTSFADVRPGTKVRLLLSDSTIFLGRPRPVGWPGIVEGRLLGIAPGDAQVRFARGYTFAIPSTAVNRLEARVGSGRCGASRARRVLCRSGVMVLGLGAGAIAGQRVGRTVGSFNIEDSGGNGSWMLAGALTFGAVSAVMLPRIGGDDWAVVHDWARGRSQP